MTTDHLTRMKFYDFFLTIAILAVALLLSASFAIVLERVAGPAAPIPAEQLH